VHTIKCQLLCGHSSSAHAQLSANGRQPKPW